MYSYKIRLQLNTNEDEQAKSATKQAALRFLQLLTVSSAQSKLFNLSYYNSKLKIKCEHEEDFTLPLAPEELLNLPELNDDCSRFNFAASFNCIFEGTFSEDNKWLIVTIRPRTESDATIVDNFFSMLSTDVEKKEISCPICI